MRKIAIALGLLITAGLVLVLRAPPTAPPTPAPVKPSEIADAIEDFVFELDLVINLERLALSQFSREQTLRFYADDFTGDAVFTEGERKTTLERRWVRMESRAAKPVGVAGLSAAWDAFFADKTAVLSSRHKVSKARRDGPDGAVASTAMELELVTPTGRVMITDSYETTLKRRAGEWKIVAQTRTDSKIATGIGGGLTPAWDLKVEPGLDCHGCAYQTPVLQLGGLAAGDYDGDGLPDLFIQRVGTPVLLHNDGAGKFHDVTKAAGLAFESIGAGALWLDIDNDGSLDLLTTALCSARHCDAGCAVRLWHNEGGGRFTNVTDSKGLRTHGQCYSASAADIDGDGRLDLFVSCYGDPFDPSGHLNYGPFGGSWINGRGAEPDLLYVQQGDGTFKECAKERGVADAGWGLACAFFDADANGTPDLYVANDFGPDRFYRNTGGQFENMTPDSAGGPGFGMGVTPIDYDNDGALDLYVSEMYSTAGNRVLDNSAGLPPGIAEKLRRAARGNSMLRNEGGTLRDVSADVGASRGGWAWSAAPFDIDNDGRADLYVANGFMSGRSRLDL